MRKRERENKNKTKQSFLNFRNLPEVRRLASVAQAVKHPTLSFGSGHDLRVVGSQH